MTPDAIFADLRKRLEFSERRRLQLTRGQSRNLSEEDGLLWSVADLMTLLLIFFVVFHGNQLRSGAEAPLPEPVPIAAPDPLPSQPPVRAPEIQPALAPAPAPEVTEALPLISAPDLPGEEASAWVDQLAADVTQLLGDRWEQAFSVRWDARRPVIVLGEQITFNEGTAELLSSFLPILSTIAQRLVEHPDYRIQVAGHTDDTPIYTRQYPSNWELSAARAVNVARFLIERGVSPQRVSFEGFAEFQPIAPNTTAAQRQLNRRVEISLLGPESE